MCALVKKFISSGSSMRIENFFPTELRMGVSEMHGHVF